MVQKTKKSLLNRLFGRLKGKKALDTPVSKPFANNTAILNDTPKNHKPAKRKVVQK